MEEAGQISDTQKKACIVCHKEFAGDVATCPDDGVTLTVLDIPRDPMVGTLFCDRFQITEVLGGGGMGMVYRAKHLMMQRSVAIKILHTKMVGNADALKRFKVEAQAASNFSHPNILNVHDFGVSNQGQPYMVMDFLEGINLTALLDSEKRVAVPRAINMFLQMSSALAHAHSKDIIHRDVKPSNIMLVEFEGRRDFVKLVDFGIAKVLNPTIPEAENLTRTGEVFGSPLYMSPEQCKGMKLDARADIYSLGAVMYRVVTGRPIFDSTDPLETMFRQVSEMPPAFAKACPDLEVPAKLEAVIFKCLEKERDNRYQSMNDLREDLEIAAAESRTALKVSTINTLPLEAERIAAHPGSDLNSDGWLNDLSENTGALPAFLSTEDALTQDKTVITNPPAARAENAGTPAQKPATPNTIPISPFADVVNSATTGASANAVPPVQASIASNTSSNSFSFSSNSGALHHDAPPPKTSTVIDKRDETISIVVNKKSVAFGSAALAALLAVAGFLYFRPAANPSGSSSASVHAQDRTTNIKSPVHDMSGSTNTAASNPPAAASIARVAKKPAPPKKKPPKRKPTPQTYYPTASNRSNYSNNSYASSGSGRNLPYPTIGSPVRSYDYQPVHTPPPVAAPPPEAVAPPPVVSAPVASTPHYQVRHVRTSFERYSNSGVSENKPGRVIKRFGKKVFSILDKITE